MDIREVDRADEAALRRYWEIGKAADNADRPYDFYVPWETALGTFRSGRPGFRDVLLGGYHGDRMVGRLLVRYPELDNRHLAFAEIHVHPDHQRRGVGRALALHAEQLALCEGRKQLLTEAFSPIGAVGPALLFAEALGYTAAIEDGMKVVDLLDTEPTWRAIEEETATRREDYTLVAWHDRVPDAQLAGYCRLNEAFNDLAPSGELDLEPEVWDEDRVRRNEDQGVSVGRHVLGVAALDGAQQVVGLTEIVVNEYAPTRGFQSGTLVLPGHRGHALGLAMKVANHRAARAAYPRLHMLLTGNAGVNVAMNAVNERLGYREIERCVEVQKELR